MKFYIETYGCTANFGNSQDAIVALVEQGHLPSSPENADAIIVNTCAVTEKTERKILRRLLQLQGNSLIVAGCLSSALPESLQRIRSRKNIGLLNGVAAKGIADLFSGSPYVRRQHGWFPASQNLCGIVNISEGCNGSCSYCIVRMARGKLISRRPEEVVDAVQKLVRSGIVEIQLASQDNAAYGLDIGTTLPELLDKVTEIPGEFMVRIGMMNPNTARPISKELIKVLGSRKVYGFLHIPVQSGSDEVLKRMGRGYSAGDFLEIVRTFRNSSKDLSVQTDVITGFPSETEEDFELTLKLIESLQPDKVNVTKYSKRPGTSAAELYDMPDRVKKERSRWLTRLWLKIARENNQRYMGRIMDALVTERGRDNSMKARTESYRGVVIQGIPALGSLQRVRITGFTSFYLTGVIVR